MRAVFFDLDGTLLHFTRDYRDLLADAFRDATGRASQADVDGYNEAFFELLGRFASRPVERAFEEVRPDANPATFAEALLDRGSRPPSRPPGLLTTWPDCRTGFSWAC